MRIRPPSSFTGEERRILFISCTCHFFTHFFILVFPAVVMPMVETLGMPLENVLKIGFLMYLCYGLFALPVGLVVDHWRAKRMLVAGVLMMGTGLLLAGALPHPHLMWVTLGLVGVGASVYHPAGLALVSRTVRQRGYALGINGVFGNLGIALAPLVTGVLTWLTSWRVTFMILGGLAAVAALFIAMLRVDERTPEGVQGRSPAGGELVRYFVIVCIALVFSGLAYRGNMILLPAYLELKTTFFRNLLDSLSFIKQHGTGTLAATVLASLVLFTGIFGQVFGGRLADRMDLRYAYLLVHAASLPFILAMAFTHNVLLALCAAGYVFFSLGMQPVENSLIAALTPDRWRSTSYAVKFILNFGIGSTAVYLIAPIKKTYSLGTVYVVLAGLTACIVGMILVLVVSSRRLASVRN